ncbi:MAG: DMT family transporter [Bacillota bacterium]|nr:DMT family transporter [Bacillota bacterium]
MNKWGAPGDRGSADKEMKAKQKAYLYLILTMVIWGSMYVFCKYVFVVMPPLVLLFLRYLIGTGVLYLLWRRGPREKIRKEDRKYILAIGGVGYFAGIGFQLVGTELCSASLASLINSMNPVVIVLLAMVVLRERATVKKLAAIGVTIVGTVVIVGQIEGGSVFWGALISVASVLCWSLGSVFVRFISDRYGTLTITTSAMAVATVLSLPVCILELTRTPLAWAEAGFMFYFSFLYICIVSTVISFLTWSRALALADAATCSLFYPIQPLVSALMGIFILKEVITLNFLVGAAFIVAGILFSVLVESAGREEALPEKAAGQRE